MKLDKKDLLLYAVTDRAWLNGQSLYAQVEQALKAGVTCLQLREKDLPLDEFISEAKEIKKLTDKYNIPLIINDSIEVAIAADADGVHIGQSDMDAKAARALIGKDKILGVSAKNLLQAQKAEQDGADYIGIGAVFSTSTKLDADNVSFEMLKTICNNINIPAVAIGGINEKNMLKLKGSGIAGVAIVSAIFASRDIQAAVKKLRNLCEEMI